MLYNYALCPRAVGEEPDVNLDMNVRVNGFGALLILIIPGRTVGSSLHVGNFVSPAQAPHMVGERLASPARARKRSDVTRGHMWAM